VNSGNAKVGVNVIVGVGVKLGVKVSVGVNVLVNVGVIVGVSVYVGVNVLVHEIAVLVAAADVWVATCSTLGLQAARDNIIIPISDKIILFKRKPLSFPYYIHSRSARKRYQPYNHNTILIIKGDQ
jgi:hypothetical protein